MNDIDPDVMTYSQLRKLEEDLQESYCRFRVEVGKIPIDSDAKYYGIDPDCKFYRLYYVVDVPGGHTSFKQYIAYAVSNDVNDYERDSIKDMIYTELRRVQQVVRQAYDLGVLK